MRLFDRALVGDPHDTKDLVVVLLFGQFGADSERAGGGCGSVRVRVNIGRERKKGEMTK